MTPTRKKPPARKSGKPVRAWAAFTKSGKLVFLDTSKSGPYVWYKNNALYRCVPVIIKEVKR